MPNNNKLFLRELSSPYGDISRKRTLSFKDLDSNFIFLKGELISNMTVEDGNLVLHKVSGENMFIPVSGISEERDSLTQDDFNSITDEIRLDIEDNKIWVWGSEGYKSVRVNNNSGTDATGDMSHAEGSNTRARGTASHAGGASSQANGDFSFAHTKGTSKADGESSVVLGGTQHAVENGGENSGVFAGDTNRILGLDYLKLIQDLQNELKVITAKREEENVNYVELQNDLSEETQKKQSEIAILNDEIKDIEAEINSLKLELNALNNQNQINLVLHQELTSAIASLEKKLQEKEELKKECETELKVLEDNLNQNKLNEANSQKEYVNRVETINRLIEEYSQIVNDSEINLPKQSAIIGGASNIINGASESIIDGGSGNTITSKVKNSGIFGGSKNELGGGDYLDLITRLLEEASQRSEEKAKYDVDTANLIKSLESNIADKEKQLESEKQQQPQDLGLIATLEAEIVELKEEKKVLEEEVSRNNEDYITYVNETDEKIAEYQSKSSFDGENFTSTITPIDNSSIIAGSGNKIIHLSDNSSIVGGKSNLIDNASGSVILGGEGITATTNNTVYTPNLNIDIQPANDNSLTQVLVRDVDGNVKYKDVSSFTDLSVVSGVYDFRTGIATFINNDGGSFEISGFTSGMTDSYTTEANLRDKTIYFNNNIEGADLYSVDLTPLLDDVINSIGLNDNRGTCSVGKYAEYLVNVNTYNTTKESADLLSSNIQTLTDEITQLNADIDILKSDLEFKLTDLIYTQITGGSVEELQIIIDQKESDLNSKQAELEQKEVEREGDEATLSLINSTGALDFAAYVPANETNFNCWVNQGIIDSVGYDDRGNCSGDRYKKYLSEYNSALEFFNTQIPSSPPSFGAGLAYGLRVPNLGDTITYNNLSTKRQKIIDYWVGEYITYTNNLISSYELEITKYQTILDTLNAIAEPTQSEQDEIDGLVKLISLLEDKKSSIEEDYAVDEESYNELIDWFDHNLSYLESTDEYNFIQEYTPINEVNFNCWNDSEDYNDLNTQITGITSAVGYDDRGSCSEEQYTSYKSEVQKYYDSKEVYDQYDSSIKTLTDNINQLNDNLLNASTQQEIDTILANIEQKQEQRQSYIDARQQIIDSGDLDFVSYVPANEVNFNCWRNDLLDDKIDTKTDKTLFNSYTSSTETVITGITSAVGYDDRGTCSEEQYTEYNAYVDLYYTSKEEYDTYESNIQILTDEITVLESSKTTKESELSTKQNELESIKPGSDFIIANSDYIITNSNSLINHVNNLKTDMEFWNYGKTETEFLAEKTSAASRIDSSIEIWNVLNDLMVINTTFNYQRKEDIIDSLTIIKNSLDDIQTILDTMVYTDTEEVFSQNKTDIINSANSSISSSQKLILDVTLSKDYYEQTNNDLKNDIQQLEQDIDSLSADIEQKQEQRQSYIVSKQQIIDSGDLDLAPYVPANEANFNCWVNDRQNDKIDSKTDLSLFKSYTSSTETTISAITSTIGIGDNDRGSCSKDRFVEYIDASVSYYNSKEVYDQYESNIKTLTDEITQLTADIDTLKTEINTLDRTILLGKLDGIDQTDNQNLKDQKESDLLAKQSQLKQKIEEKERDVESQEEIKNSGALEFAPYVPVNEVNFNCWENNELNKITRYVSDSLGAGHRGSCDGKTYNAYRDLVKDLEDRQAQNNLYVNDINRLTQERNLEHQNYTKERAVITDNIDFYQRILKQINQTIEDEGRDATPEELGKIAILEQLINDLQTELNALDVSENTAVESYSEAIDIRNELINHFENNIKPDIDKYLPENEVNYNCWRNELFFNDLDTKVQTIKKEVDCQIYDIESILIENSDLPGTFNYYPNIYDEFTENPKFIIGEFDDLDNIINLDGGDLRSWGKLICLGGSHESPNVLGDNLIQSIRCIEALIDDITNTENELSNDFNSLKSNYEQQLAILQGLQNDDPAISTDALELKISNMVEKRDEEHVLVSYMVEKLYNVLAIYEQVKQIAQNFCQGAA
jgi:chromosome segregation ATPase